MLRQLGLWYNVWRAWIVRLHNRMWPNRGDARTASRFGCRIVMRFIVTRTRTRTVGNVRLNDSVRRGNFCGFDREGSRRYTTQLPIDIGVDSFEPRHSENHLVAAKGSDKENFFVENASDRKLENDNAISVDEFRSVGDGNINRSAWYCGKSQCKD